MVKDIGRDRIHSCFVRNYTWVLLAIVFSSIGFIARFAMNVSVSVSLSDKGGTVSKVVTSENHTSKYANHTGAGVGGTSYILQSHRNDTPRGTKVSANANYVYNTKDEYTQQVKNGGIGQNSTSKRTYHTKNISVSEVSTSSSRTLPQQHLFIVTAANRLGGAIEYLNASSLEYAGLPLKIVINEGTHKHFVKVDVMRKVHTMVPSPDSLVMFVDAFDTLVTISAEEIVQRFASLERKFNLTNAVAFNGCSNWCFPFELWKWKTNEVITLTNGVKTIGKEICNGFRARFGGDDPCLNSGVYIGRARDVAKVNQFVWDNQNVTSKTDQSLYMQATKVFPNMIVDSNSTFMTTTHTWDIESDLCASHDVNGGVLHFTGRNKAAWISKCSKFYLGSGNETLMLSSGHQPGRRRKGGQQRRKRGQHRHRRNRRHPSDHGEALDNSTLRSLV
ncbi:hypothetical protein ACHAWF_011750 [Thalassiosira exigua]